MRINVGHKLSSVWLHDHGKEAAMALSAQAQAIYDNLVQTEYKKPFSEEASFAALVDAMGEAQKQRYELPGFVSEAEGVAIEDRTICEGCRIFTMTPADGVLRSGKHVLFYHGGALLINIMDTQWTLAQSLVERLGCTVHMLEYPLAPTYTHRETYRSIMDAYRWVLDKADPGKIVLLGDSVGAHLAIAAAQFALRDGLPQPAQIIVLSPWIDFANELPGKADLEAGDPIIGMVSLIGIPQAWCPDIVAEHACPPNLQYGPFEGMAPVYIQVGTTEVLKVDACELERLIREAGGEVELELGEGLWHTYALYPDMPEGRAAVERIACCIERA